MTKDEIIALAENHGGYISIDGDLTVHPRDIEAFAAALTAQPAAPAVVESHERMRALLNRLNLLGGLGFDAHDRISAVLAAAPTPPEGPQP